MMKLLLQLVLLQVLSASAVRIMNLGVPASYVLDENFCRPLILDCDYEFQVSDIGFVLKWYHNNHLIYQWIPPRKPYMFSVQKYQINPSFIITDNPMYKHRAILLQPKQNLSGEWMCSVSTYHTRDRQIKTMKIIVPEKSFELYQHDMNFINEASDFFVVICTVTRITPEPELSLNINNDFKIISETKHESDEKGFFNKSIMARIDKRLIASPSTIQCNLIINGTNYIKKKQFIYYDKNFDTRLATKYERFSMSSSSKFSCRFNFKAILILLTFCLKEFSGTLMENLI